MCIRDRFTTSTRAKADKFVPFICKEKVKCDKTVSQIESVNISNEKNAFVSETSRSLYLKFRSFFYLSRQLFVTVSW